MLASKRPWRSDSADMPGSSIVENLASSIDRHTGGQPHARNGRARFPTDSSRRSGIKMPALAGGWPEVMTKLAERRPELDAPHARTLFALLDHRNGWVRWEAAHAFALVAAVARRASWPKDFRSSRGSSARAKRSSRATMPPTPSSAARPPRCLPKGAPGDLGRAPGLGVQACGEGSDRAAPGRGGDGSALTNGPRARAGLP